MCLKVIRVAAFTTREWPSGNVDLGEWINPSKQCRQFSLGVGFMGSCCSCAKLRESQKGCPRSDIVFFLLMGELEDTERQKDTEAFVPALRISDIDV